VNSRQELVQFLRAEYDTFPDAKEEIADTVVEGQKVAVRVRFRGTQSGFLGRYAPSGRTVESEYLAIYRVENGMIVEAWAEWDNLSTLRQLGHLA
jgi:predicted ester cyclase